MPTLLGLCGLEVPDTVEGRDFSPYLRGEDPDFDVEAVILECVQPFGEFAKMKPGTYPEEYAGGREYRGIRTKRYTYVADLRGPWLLYDNQKDPYQKENLVGRQEYQQLSQELDRILRRMLKERKDEFLPGSEYVKQWNYTVDESGTLPYSN